MNQQLHKMQLRSKIGKVGCLICRSFACGFVGPDKQVKRTSKRVRRRYEKFLTQEMTNERNI